MIDLIFNLIIPQNISVKFENNPLMCGLVCRLLYEEQRSMRVKREIEESNIKIKLEKGGAE